MKKYVYSEAKQVVVCGDFARAGRSHFCNDTENTHKFIVLIISNFDIRVVPRFSSSFSSFGRNQIEVVHIQPLTAFAFQMISNAKVRFFLRIIANHC